VSGSSVPGRRTIDRKTAGRVAGAAAILVILGAILGPSVLNNRPSATLPDSTQVAARPSPSGPEQPTLGPAASGDTWADLDVPAFQELAAFSPNDGGIHGVGLSSSFTLRSLTSTPAADLVRGLHIVPPIEFRTEPGPTPDVALVVPTGHLAQGSRYQVRLDAPDGALAGAWAFTTEAPLRVVETVPGDMETDVPTDTGIEVQFDQDGATGVADHFRIEPVVAGRFEQHDRIWSFVPQTRLVPATVYTVTVLAGVAIEGSAGSLAQDVTFRFETGAAKQSARRLAFERPIHETRPGERPVLPLGEWYAEDDSPPPSSVSVEVFRLANLDDAIDAARVLAGRDAWAVYSASRLVDTTRLTRVGQLAGKVLQAEAGLFLRVPFEPAAGFYVLTIVQKGPPAQLLLQVTDVAAYALTGTTDSVVWANDLATGGALAGASVSMAGGAVIGQTDANGLLRAATPAGLRLATVPSDGAPKPALLTVRTAQGRSLILPVGLSVAWYAAGYEGPYQWDLSDDSANWWLLLRTDRQTYRPTDTINVSGLIRARSDRSVPGGLELRLRPEDSPGELFIQRVPVVATERGVFTASLHVEDLPRGAYTVELFAGEKGVSSVSVQVDEIRKPAFRIDVETDRHVYVAGQRMSVSANAAFYDGTPVPGVALRFSGFEQHTRRTSDALGAASATLRTPFGLEPGGWLSDVVGVAPAHAEEGQIEGSAPVVVLPSRIWIVGSGTATAGGRIVVHGTLSWADIAGLEAKLDAGGVLEWGKDGPGKPIGSGTVRARIVHYVAVRTQTGTSYDFIEKRVVPLYDYTTREIDLGTQTLTSAGDGTFRLSRAIPVATDDYRVELSATDPEGRRFRLALEIGAGYRPSNSSAPFLVQFNDCGGTGDVQTGLGQPLTVTMHDGDGTVARSGRFLFLVSRQGSMEATVQSAATFRRVLGDADLPGFTVRAIWLSARGYFSADASAIVNADDKRITITLAPDKGRYQPGGHATVGIMTTGPNGSPVAADVVVQGVDEKLFTLGLAADEDPAPTLMHGIEAGFLQSYTSHRLPAYTDEGGCGGAGGDDRSQFKDTLAFQRVTTGSDGRGTVDFDLPDDLTSWHVTATAVDASLDSGLASTQLPVGLPFFVDGVLAPEYLTGEEPVLRVRAFGQALSAADKVRFTVDAPTLGVASVHVTGNAFDALRVPLPKVAAGDHQIHIEAEAVVGGQAYRDAIVRTIHVVGTRLAGLVTHYDVLGPDDAPRGGPGLTTYTVSDQGRGRLIELLQGLAWDRSGRFDKTAAASVSRRLLISEFGLAPDSLPDVDFDAGRYQQGGISLLSYSSTDLFLSATAALSVPDLVDTSQLAEAFYEWSTAEGGTREQTIVALAGSAAIGEDVTVRLNSYVPSDLTVRERLWLALGLAASGDERAARAIERDLLESAGQRLGPWVRLSVGTDVADTLEASSLLLLLAARLGDPLAGDISTYLREVPSEELVFPLEQIAYIRASLDRLPREPGRFAWTVAGDRHEVTLPPGGATTLVLTNDQRASLKLEPLDGELAVVTSWTSSDFTLPTSASLRIERTVTPSRDAPDDHLVRVTIHVAFGSHALPGCYRLTDVVPSGLAPVVRLAVWPDDEEEPQPAGNWPYAVGGQEVSWCASPDDRSHDYTYSARVVSPGTYRWEPAILQFELDPRVGASTPSTTYAIR